MDDLIEALQIFRKYKNLAYPTACGHDVLYILGVDQMLYNDHQRVLELGFLWDDDEDGYYSYKYGS